MRHFPFVQHAEATRCFIDPFPPLNVPHNTFHVACSLLVSDDVVWGLSNDAKGIIKEQDNCQCGRTENENGNGETRNAWGI
jgi:hypothetical protein